MNAILDAVADHAVRRPGAVAWREPGDALSYGALAREIDRLAARLRTAGVGAGAVVAVESARLLRAVVAALAARRAGGVPILHGAGAPPSGAASVIVVPGAGGEIDLRPQAPAAGDADVTLPPGTAWLRSTTGSSGQPRLVAFDEAQAAAGARTHADLLGLQPGEGVVVTVPPATAYGFNAWLGPIMAGASLTFVPPLSPRGLLEALREDGVTWGCSTPPMARALASLPDDAGAGAPRLRRRIIVGAAAYPADEAPEIERRHGVLVIERYGATEAGPIAQADEPGTPLRPARALALRLAGEPPTLEVAGPAVATGYVGGAAFGGVFRTADAADLAPDGTFRLRGRRDRIVKRMSRAVDLTSIERAVIALTGVARARVRVVPGRFDIDFVAQVVARPGTEPTPASLLAALSSLPAWERPARVDVVPEAAVADLEKWQAAEPGA